MPWNAHPLHEHGESGTAASKTQVSNTLCGETRKQTLCGETRKQKHGHDGHDSTCKAIGVTLRTRPQTANHRKSNERTLHICMTILSPPIPTG